MKRSKAFVLLTSAVAGLAVLYACTGDDSNPTTTTTPPTPVQDSGGTPITPADTGPVTPTNDATPPPVDSGPQPPTCFSGTPTTYLEIINACTDAQAIDKNVDLSPMNLPDGGLQPLP
jgi:hypothetical protein